MQKTTMGELGFVLPIGRSVGDGPRAGNFNFKSWRGSDEREIGAMRDRHRAIGAPEFTSRILCRFLTAWCDQPIETMSGPEKLLELTGAYASDVLTAWVQLRRMTLGDKLASRIVCSVCREGFNYDLDLSEMEVVVLGDDELRQPFALRDGLEWAGRQHELLTLEPVKWSVYGAAVKKDGLNTGSIKMRIAAASIVGLDGHEGDVALPHEALDGMTKYDLEHLTAVIGEGQPGPDLAIETACPECGSPISRSVPWTYDSFFSVRASSTSGRQIRSGRSSSFSATASQAS